MALPLIQTHYGIYQEKIETALVLLDKERIITRIWDHDHTVWKPDPTEITNRLGWLEIAGHMEAKVSQIQNFTEQLCKEGYTHALLLGMGGSSLAPEVFRKIFGVRNGFLDLAVLDSTHPDEVQKVGESLNLSRTLFIVSTKSGGTVETISLFKYFYTLVARELGEGQAGDHFAAITDPGSTLELMARHYKFREIFLNDPNIGGRYSALSSFGLVPAGLLGIEIPKLLQRAIEMAASNELSVILGTMMGILAKEGRDKLTFLFPEKLTSLGDWIEQLIAESTGKEGKGILPVVGEPLGTLESYGKDRFFVSLNLAGDQQNFSVMESPIITRHPIVEIKLNDLYDLGGQFFLWEFATAIASYWLNINPFDQPNVESAKVLARHMVSEYQVKGFLPKVDTEPCNPEILLAFLKNTRAGDYIALQAYLQPLPETRVILEQLREKLRNQYRLATTLGFGPRYLHSTGQLHKGDAGKGFFIILTSEPKSDLPIPDNAGKSESSMSFGTLILAQALGDQQALLNAKRRVLHLHLSQDIFPELIRLV